MKDKNYMIISLNAEKEWENSIVTYDKKILNKVDIEGNVPQHNKGHV